MHVLLTGAGGFVGHHVLEHFLVNTDAYLTLTDSFRHRGTSERITEVLEGRPGSHGRVSVLTHDLTTPWSQYGISAIREHGDVDVILQIASESHVDRSIAEPVPFVRNNVDVALNALELARTLEPKVFVLLSTDEVYGPVPLGRPSIEWDPILPSNPYSASKAAQEAIAISYWRTYDVPLVIVNGMNLIGERQHPEKFIPKVIASVIDGKPVPVHCSSAIVRELGSAPLRAEDTERVERAQIGRRCYLHARNLADAMLFLVRDARIEGAPLEATVRYDPSGRGAGVFPQRFHVIGEQEVDNLTMAERIAAFAGKPLVWEAVDFHSTRPGHDLRYAMDGRRLQELGWTPPVPLWDSLSHVVRWTLEHPRWMVH
ncbi:MAG TPA: NAD-dependent epimerase/dehydratase family protein [Candidatus Dormibacteraeota bacterium]|nr:NAD-dependent epimerase/dehydratase family protein [Candidatus Dormibacteraeota bacterium]